MTWDRVAWARDGSKRMLSTEKILNRIITTKHFLMVRFLLVSNFSFYRRKLANISISEKK